MTIQTAAMEVNRRRAGVPATASSATEATSPWPWGGRAAAGRRARLVSLGEQTGTGVVTTVPGQRPHRERQDHPQDYDDRRAPVIPQTVHAGLQARGA